MDGGRDWPMLALPPTTVFCDVTTDLIDAAIIFGPQKGARPEDIPVLTQRLSSLGLPRGSRTGAAGGLGARLAWLGACRGNAWLVEILTQGIDNALRV